MDNLCQFLPQDRVQDFARLNQQDLLISTEKAVREPGLYEAHNERNEKKIQKITNQSFISDGKFTPRGAA